MSWADCFKLLLFWVHSGENPVSPAIPKEVVGRVSGLENKRREATPGLPGKGPLGLLAAQRGPWASPPPPPPQSLQQKHMGSSLQRIPAPCKAPNRVGAASTDPRQVWRALPPCAAAYYPCFKALYFHGAARFHP